MSASRDQWELCLYIADRNLTSVTACANLERICEDHLRGRFHIEVVGVLKQPERARRDNIVAIPTLLRGRPSGARRIIGDLSNTRRVLAALNLGAAEQVS